jgi:hypothetical protein
MLVLVVWQPSKQIPRYLTTKNFDSALQKLRERDAHPHLHLCPPTIHIHIDMPTNAAVLLLPPLTVPRRHLSP